MATVFALFLKSSYNAANGDPLEQAIQACQLGNNAVQIALAIPDVNEQTTAYAEPWAQLNGPVPGPYEPDKGMGYALQLDTTDGSATAYSAWAATAAGVAVFAPTTLVSQADLPVVPAGQAGAGQAWGYGGPPP